MTSKLALRSVNGVQEPPTEIPCSPPGAPTSVRGDDGESRAFVEALTTAMKAEEAACAGLPHEQRWALAERLVTMVRETLEQTAPPEAATGAVGSTALYDLCCALSFAATLEEIAEIVAGYSVPLGAEVCMLVTFTGRAEEAAASAQLAAAWPLGAELPGIQESFSLRESPLRQLLLAQELVISEDVARSHAIDVASRRALLAAGWQCVLSAPLLLRARLSGRLLLAWPAPRRFSAQEMRLITSLANQASAVAERIVLMEESARQVRELELLRAELEAAVSAQRELVRELSAPLIPVADGVVVMPLIGRLDEARMSQARRVLLDGAGRGRVTAAIVDLTGVPAVDPPAIDGFARIARGLRLLGARTVITGIRPEVARALVDVGPGLGGFAVRPTVERGIALAMSRSLHRTA
ncbi:GAF domain-containing protein [Sorangium sp. So ce124]|uniref:GAF domain-containing protein n=1 Tax=Sorangium sp. So ce124 TaxID=3133280 RepID=UPI003F62A5A0